MHAGAADPCPLPSCCLASQGYQGKRIDNTSVRDEPYEFVLGGGQVSRQLGHTSNRMFGCKHASGTGDS